MRLIVSGEGPSDMGACNNARGSAVTVISRQGR